VDRHAAGTGTGLSLGPGASPAPDSYPGEGRRRYARSPGDTPRLPRLLANVQVSRCRPVPRPVPHRPGSPRLVRPRLPAPDRGSGERGAPPSGLAVQGRCLRRMAVAPQAAGRGPRPLPVPTHGGAGRSAAPAQAAGTRATRRPRHELPMALTCILYGVSAEDIAAILNRVRLSREGPAPHGPRPYQRPLHPGRHECLCH
jgi:hypothetical protein